MTKIELEVKIQSLWNEMFELNGKILGAYEIVNNLINPNSPAWDKSKEYIAKWENKYIELHSELDKLEKEYKIIRKGQYE